MVVETSRWCKPPAADSKKRSAPAGRWIKGGVHQIQRRCGVTRMIPFSVAAAVPAAFLRASQAARLPLQLRSIDHRDFPLVSPAVSHAQRDVVALLQPELLVAILFERDPIVSGLAPRSTFPRLPTRRRYRRRSARLLRSTSFAPVGYRRG